jgi:ParB/RepB/Spo0J family partition protein
MKEQFCVIPIHSLEYSKKNPRQEIMNLEELAASIKEYGILEPVIVKPIGEKFEVIVGERRVRAAVIAGLKEVPAIVRNPTEQQADEIRLIENIHRADLTDSEKGDAIYSMLLRYPDRYGNIRDIAESMKIPYHTIQNWCSKSRKLSNYIQQLVAGKELTERAAQLLLKYNHETQDKLGGAIVQLDIHGRGDAERKFVQLYDENPNTDLRKLAEKAKSSQTVQVSMTELSPPARKEVKRVIERRKERTKQLRQRAAKNPNRFRYEENEKYPVSLGNSIRNENSLTPREAISEKAEAIIQRLTEIEHPLQRDRMMREIPRAMESLAKRVDEAPQRREIIEDKLQRLRELEDEGVFLSTLWDIGKRADYAGTRDFHGNCPPQVVEQCLLRLTKEGDLVVDPMAGSGTVPDVCSVLDRKCLAYDIRPTEGRNDIMRNDSRKLPLDNDIADMVFLHPPYWNMVYYTKAEDKLMDLSRAETFEKFLDMLREVLQEAHRILKRGKFLCVLIGDRVKDGRFVPICRKVANLAEEAGLTDHGYAVKFTQGATSQRKKGKIVYAETAFTENLKIGHDMVMFFRKDTDGL